MKSDVYLVKINSQDLKARGLALKRLLERVLPFNSYRKNELIPVKLTTGDSSCVYNINPDWVKIIISEINKRGAKPFLFDTSVIYEGQRQNAVDHLNLVQYKGFCHSKVGAPFIIADGLLGQDGKEQGINSESIRKIKVPSFVGMLDSLLVLTHATGHILSIYAGAIKNVAMGISCRPTKQVQHSSLKPQVIAGKCAACGCCIAACPVTAISYKPEGSGLASNSQSRKNNKAYIDKGICIGCGECLCACKFDAVKVNWHEDVDVFCGKMVDVAEGILSKFKNKFFITFALDITKECDCISDKDEKIIAADIGILASRDIVSLDKATAHLITIDEKSGYMRKSRSVYEKMFQYAQNKGLGNPEYNLIEI